MIDKNRQSANGTDVPSEVANTTPSTTDVIRELDRTPSNWRFTPNGNKKNAYLKDWQNRPLTHEEIKRELLRRGSPARAIGLVLGETSGSIVAIDHDGASSDDVIRRLSGLEPSEALPKTVTVTSGMHGRYCAFYYVPHEYRHLFQRLIYPELKSGVRFCSIRKRNEASEKLNADSISACPINPTGDEEKLEIRFNGSQQTIIGHHPDTDGYRWIHPPLETAIADCPDWLIHFLERKHNEEVERIANSTPHQSWIGTASSDDIHRALDFIDPTDRDTWIRVGMGLKDHDEKLFSVWDEWSSRAASYRGTDDCERTWNSFKKTDGHRITLGTVFTLAKNNGWKKTMNNFRLQVLQELYSDSQHPWICVKGTLYQWTGNHYQKREDKPEEHRILKAFSGEGVSTHAIREALEYVKTDKYVPLESTNPPGLNCTNGVLLIEWNGKVPSFRLVPHSPERYFLYEPLAAYDPEANPDHCDRLLSVLDPEPREIILRTIAAVFDLPMIRKLHGREVRCVLALGTGANGKDSIREAVSMLFGRTGITNVPLEAFEEYDQGKRFGLARLMTSRINWASESRKGISIDNLQSLKAFVTGDEIVSERKGKDPDTYNPSAVTIFNINDIPSIKGGLDAIRGRFAIVPFTKTFKKEADPLRGEVEADSRYRYDTDFIQQEILPALLNRLLQALTALASEGIDYASSEKVLEETRAENYHLYEFAQEFGLVEDPNGEVQIGELWKALEAWYVENDVLTIHPYTGSRSWADEIRPGDPWVRGSNQVSHRFRQLFPKVREAKRRMNKKVLVGLRVDLVNQVSQWLATSETAYPTSKPSGVVDSEKMVSQLANLPNHLEKNKEVCDIGYIEEEKLDRIAKLANQANQKPVEPLPDKAFSQFETAYPKTEVANQQELDLSAQTNKNDPYGEGRYVCVHCEGRWYEGIVQSAPKNVSDLSNPEMSCWMIEIPELNETIPVWYREHLKPSVKNWETVKDCNPMDLFNESDRN